MDNKYIMAEEIDFEIDEFNEINYIGNNEGIEYIDITNFVTENKLKSLDFMFSNIESRKIKGVKNNYKDITDLESCFQFFIGTSLNLSEFKTDNVISFNNTFFCSEIEELNLSNFNTKNGVDFSSMFSNSKIKKLNLNRFSFENKKVIMFYMFDSFTCDELVIPNSFPINFDEDIFLDSKIKTIKTFNKEFYKKHKEWFKNNHGTELILIS